MSQRGIAEGDFASAITLYHAYGLMLQHGLRTFYNFMARTMGEGVAQVAGASKTPNFGINRLV